jgi:hypothetical protein
MRSEYITQLPTPADNKPKSRTGTVIDDDAMLRLAFGNEEDEGELVSEVIAHYSQ